MIMEFDSDDELEQFQVTQHDLDTEFMPRRGKRKFTKEDAIYGLWAEHDSDEERCVCVCVCMHACVDVNNNEAGPVILY